MLVSPSCLLFGWTEVDKTVTGCVFNTQTNRKKNGSINKFPLLNDFD
jgi:hypothetical protein